MTILTPTVNPQSQPVLYIGGTANTLTVVLTNASGQSLPLVPGEAVQETAAASSPTTLVYLSLGSLLDADEAQHMVVTASGWNSTFMTGSIDNAWCLTPASSSALADGDSVTATLASVACTSRPATGYLTVSVYATPAQDSAQAPVVVQNPPSPGLQTLVLDCAFLDGNTVYVTPVGAPDIANTLTFHVTNPSPTTPIVPADIPWGPTSPMFLLTPLYASPPGSGALCEATSSHITLGPAEIYADSWHIDRNDTGAGGPTWTLTPRQHEVLGVGEGSTVQFVMDDIVTKLDAGYTQLYLQWSEIPGYNDGYTTGLGIQKVVPSQGILHFWTDTASIAPGGSVHLSWITLGAASVTLTITADNEAPVVVNSTDGTITLQESGLTKQPLKDTSYTLRAYDAEDNQMGDDSQQLVAVTTPPHVAVTSPLVSATSMAPGQSVTIAYGTENAVQSSVSVEGFAGVVSVPLDNDGSASCLISSEDAVNLNFGSAGGQTLGTIAMSNPSPVSIVVVITASGSSGESNQATVDLAFVLPQIDTFEFHVVPNPLDAYEMLEWGVSNALSCTLTPYSGQVSLSGSVNVGDPGPPFVAYTLTCLGFGPPVSQTKNSI